MSEINVNLAACDCAVSYAPMQHTADCAAAPVLVPCHIPPRVELQVALGECVGCIIVNDTRGYRRETIHDASCPGRPVRVSCSISGTTWTESEVADVAQVGVKDEPWDRTECMHALTACRERWVLAKALVAGRSTFIVGVNPGKQNILMLQRDAVFAALADMAKAEEAASVAQNRAHAALGDDLRLRPHHNEESKDRPAAYMLERYVEHLIGRVGTL